MKIKLKNNKWYIFICGGLAVIILVSLIAFGINRIQIGKSRQKDSNVSSQEVVTAAYLNACYGEDGYFWIGDDELLHYADGGSGKETVACSLPGCEHEPYDEQSNPDPVCQADAHSVLTMIQNGKYIYLIKAEETQEVSVDYTLYRQDVNGENRRKLMDLPGTAEMMFLDLVCDGRNIAVSYLVYGYMNERGGYEELDERIAGVYLIDVDSLQTQDFKASERVKGSREAIISGISLENDTLYYAMNYHDAGFDREEEEKMDAMQQEVYDKKHSYRELGIYDIKQQRADKLDEEQIDGKVILKGNLCLYQSRDGILQYRYIDTRESAIRDGDDSKCHLSREKTKCVLYEPEQGSTEHISYLVDGIMGDHVYYSYYDEKTDTETWYQYDSATGKTRTFSPEKNLLPVYLSDQYMYLWVLDDTGEATGYKCVTEDAFITGKLE